MVAFLALMALFAVAADGKIQIPFASPVTTPVVISVPGSYVVIRNLAHTGSGPIIRIQVVGVSGNVQIDLNSMVLDNAANTPDAVIEAIAAPGSSVAIRNGSLLGGSSGIKVDAQPGGRTDIVVEDVTISGFAAGSLEAGIYLSGSLDFALRRNIITDTDTTAGVRGQGN